MEYTVNGLARLAGVSVRTLHWYDEIGLLRPARVTEAGYRMYGPDEVDALQSILFYRALGVPLKQIGALMADASAGRLAALQSHRAALLCRRAQLDALLATVQMPSGIPVATVAINGAKNAAVLAAQILAVSDDALAARLDEAREKMAQQIAEKEAKLQAEL